MLKHNLSESQNFGLNFTSALTSNMRITAKLEG